MVAAEVVNAEFIFEGADVGELSLQRTRDGSDVDGFGVGSGGEPLLENASGTKATASDFVELLGIEEAGTGGWERWWRIDGDEIELVGGAFKKAAAVVDFDVRERGRGDLV